MQEIRDLLRQREQQVEKLQREIEALRTTIAILEVEQAKPEHRFEGGGIVPQNGNGQYSAAVALKQFP